MSEIGRQAQATADPIASAVSGAVVRADAPDARADAPDIGAAKDPIERTVTGLGYELVEVERLARGLLRIYIDRVPGKTYPEAQGAGEFVTVDDCEVVTRQLQYVLEVEQVAYERLEVSSPGLDRPLKKPADFQRFAGQAVEIALKVAFQGRKHWKGVLSAGSEAGQFCLALDASQAQHAAGSELAFTLDEVREARLVPVIDFKRGRAKPSDVPHSTKTNTQ